MFYYLVFKMFDMVDVNKYKVRVNIYYHGLFSFYNFLSNIIVDASHLTEAKLISWSFPDAFKGGFIKDLNCNGYNVCYQRQNPGMVWDPKIIHWESQVSGSLETISDGFRPPTSQKPGG